MAPVAMSAVEDAGGLVQAGQTQPQIVKSSSKRAAPLQAAQAAADGLPGSQPFGLRVLRRTLSFTQKTLVEHIKDDLVKFRNYFIVLLSRLVDLGRDSPILLSHLPYDEFQKFATENNCQELGESDFAQLLLTCQEVVVVRGKIGMVFRTRPGDAQHVIFTVDPPDVEATTVSRYLAFKERIVSSADAIEDPWKVLEIDVGVFKTGPVFPKLTMAKSIGTGVTHLNRHLSSKMFMNDEHLGKDQLLEFLRKLKIGGETLMIESNRINGVAQLQSALLRGDKFLEQLPDETLYRDVAPQLQEWGLMKGWGANVAIIRESFRLLLDILQAPSADVLDQFLSRLPFISKVAIMSPHGFFGQANVLGKPDTGGQVVYILDQVRALERELVHRMEEMGLEGVPPQIIVVTRLIPDAGGTSCDERCEHIAGTQHSYILRIPFKDATGRVLRKWVSRFDIWPHLERFASDCAETLLREMQGKPDLLIGNYSDGNLVASLLSSQLGVTQCNIAHALEKTKYKDADIQWRQFDDQYHFSCQFTADIIAMNCADFIITSTYQEIAGNDKKPGQYESMKSMSLPGLYRVIDGIDVYDPKFNIVSPGADAEVYFPYTSAERRIRVHQAELQELLYGRGEAPLACGVLEEPSRPALFSMARLDRVKNLTGLVEWYARSPRLRSLVNLVIVGGVIDENGTDDREERDECIKMHALITEHKLQGQMRWLVAQKDRVKNGELYRMIADGHGAFVQPATYEAFGLTVVEAMSCGLPVFATNNGGPAEIIVDNRSGFHIDPYHGELAAELMADFYEKCNTTGWNAWDDISKGALQRIQSRYTWELYAKRLMTLSTVYSFWKQVTGLERRDARRYMEMFYNLMMRGLSAGVPVAETETVDAAEVPLMSPSLCSPLRASPGREGGRAVTPVLA